MTLGIIVSDFENENGIPASPDDGRKPPYPSYPTTIPTLPPRTNSFAITSFVLAFFATIISIVFGHIALSQIKRTGEKGRGLALSGLWISYLQIVAAIVTVGIILGISISAQNAYKSSVSLGDNNSTGTQTYGYVPPAAAPDPGVPAATDPPYSQPTAAPEVGS